MNIFYPRSLISLIIIISYIKEKKLDKTKNILILEKKNFSLFINSLPQINFLSDYFKSIKYISTEEIVHKIFSYNYFKFYFYVNNRIKKTINNPYIRKILKIKFNKYYGSGTYLDDAFYKKNKKAKFYFVEHGIGNIVHFYNLKVLKLKINYLIKFFLNLFFKNTRTKYNGYIGILNKHFKNNIYINEHKIKKNIKVNSINVIKIFSIFSKIYSKFLFLKKNTKKNYILFNWNFLIKPNKNIIIKIINDHKINLKKNVLLIKLHYKTSYNNYNNYNLLTRTLRLNKVNFKIINKRISFLPLEFFIYHFKIKNVISLMSSTIFYTSIIFPKINKSLYFSLNNNLNKKYYTKEHSISALNIYKKNFKGINYY
jgi:hypothetical protein